MPPVPSGFQVVARLARQSFFDQVDFIRRIELMKSIAKTDFGTELSGLMSKAGLQIDPTGANARNVNAVNGIRLRSRPKIPEFHGGLRHVIGGRTGQVGRTVRTRPEYPPTPAMFDCPPNRKTFTAAARVGAAARTTNIVTQNRIRVLFMGVQLLG